MPIATEKEIEIYVLLHLLELEKAGKIAFLEEC
jgi:hypothetical protein